MSNIESDKIIDIAALGRPFRLGMLYDCRTEKLIPGITLWDTATLNEKVSQKLGTSDFELIASDSLEDKASALDITASLKLSFLGGLLNVSGSAKYLDNRKSSSHQERVTLKYKCTTKFEEMTMEQLGKGKVQHPEVFDHGTATHVVTGVEYGGQAFFVFDKQHSSSSQDKDVGGTLHVMVKSIPGMKIDGEGKLKLTEEEKKNAENFSCRFFGDFLPQENPSSYEDAVWLYKHVPKLLGEEGQNAVPIKVRLYPLVLLDSKASRLVREISAHLVSKTEETLEDLYHMDVKCNDLLNSKAVQKFQGIKKEISRFKTLLSTYKLGFQRQLSLLLPGIRGGGQEESKLADALREKEKSPFSSQALRMWIESKESQVKILTEYTNALSEIKFASEPGDLQALLMKPDNTHVLCFSIIMPKSNKHLTDMVQYVDEGPYSRSQDSDMVNSQLLKDNGRSMMEKARHFRDFFHANKTVFGTAFIVGEEISNTEDFHAKISYYKDGKLLHKDYEIPTVPGIPEAVLEECTHKSIKLQWSLPPHGACSVTEYEVTFQQISSDAFTTIKTRSSDPSYTLTNLTVNTLYQFSVRSCCDAGKSHSSAVCPPIKTRPTSPPGKPYVWEVSALTVGIKWEMPKCIGKDCSIHKFVIRHQQKGGRWCKSTSTKSGNEIATTLQVTPNVVTRFKVYADCGLAGNSLNSEYSEGILVKAKAKDLLKARMCASSKVSQENGVMIYQPELRMIVKRENDRIGKYEIGKPDHATPEKVIMMVGGTGSGKTTLINGIVNHIFGVKWKDPFRFKLIIEPNSDNQAKSQTTDITSYTIYHQDGSKVPYTLTVIDTPGFNDDSGLTRDKEIINQIYGFFSTQGAGGIDHIDAVGFVVQSALPRLTPTQRYIFDQILSLFGKNMAENIFLLLTFSDNQTPQVLSGIKEADIPYKGFYKFNNSSLFVNSAALDLTNGDEDSDDEEIIGNSDAISWKMGMKSYKMFLQELNKVESKSLYLTKDVLHERKQLEINITGIQTDIHIGLITLERLRKEETILRTYQSDIDKNKNFKYTVEEERIEKEAIPPGQYITNCLQCNRTCHDICIYRDDERKAECWAMTNDYCRICPSKCHWSVHKNFPYRFVPTVVIVTKTAKDLRKRYQEAKEKKLSAEGLIAKVQEEFQAVQLKVLGMTEAVRKSLERLKEIALKPNPLSTVEYIDILIETEKSQARPGWQARMQQLERVKKEAEYMQQIASEGFDPFKEYRVKIEKEKKSNKRGIWTRAEEYLGHIFS